MTGEELRRLRGRLTHEEMAVRIGVHRSTLQRAEARTFSDVPHLLALAVTHVLRCRRKRAGGKTKP